jgi:hypothetical protein
LYRDWASRDRWLTAVLEIDDPKTFAAELVASHKQLRRLAYKTFLSAENDYAKVSALNLVRNINKDLSELVCVPHIMAKLERLEGER